MRKLKLTTPRPFLKWVGGKTQLLPELVQRVERAGNFKRYHEPFVGGGALFFELYRSGRLDGKPCFLSDANVRLVESYQAVKEDVETLIELLREHKDKHNHDYYYAVRAQVPEERTARAARIIYLNKTCYNGLYRENSRGEFNVPLGKYKNPLICDEDNLRAVSAALQHAEIRHQHFRQVLKLAKRGDFVYFDPPYHPVSATSSFTSYDQSNFVAKDQEELADLCTQLNAKGVKFLLSNSYTPFICDLYNARGLTQIDRVEANRMVNSNAGRRGKVGEALVHNFDAARAKANK